MPVHIHNELFSGYDMNYLHVLIIVGSLPMFIAAWDLIFELNLAAFILVLFLVLDLAGFSSSDIINLSNQQIIFA